MVLKTLYYGKKIYTNNLLKLNLYYILYMTIKKISPERVESILGIDLSDEIKNRINDFNMTYTELSKEERDEYILKVMNVLNSDITVSGKHRIEEWEKGWGENFNKFKESGNIEDLIPRYHSKYDIVRWDGDVVKPTNPNFDYKIHICLIDTILHHYSKDMNNVYEFGCGPGYHLIRLFNHNNELNITGCDWAKSSQSIINTINETLSYDIKSHNFDFFNPDFNLNFGEKSLIYTVAALEQVGENFTKFIDFLMDKKPDLCIHFEPIDELLDENKLIDNLSIKYFRKRNYLKGFLPYLENLEKEGKIEIIKKQRIYSGSFFIEGHSLIIWRIKK